MARNEFPNKTISGNFYLPLRQDGRAEDFALEVDFEIPGNGVTGIFGPSGSGKTTLLRCIAGLQPCANGSLTVNGITWQQSGDPDKSLAVHERPLGFVFQQPSLFPHLSAKDNLAFARKRATTAVSDEEYDEIIALMGIDPLLEQRPDALSGGEQQRVAIARALLVRPGLLLMDEPLAALDHARKREIMPYLEKLHTSLDIPILYVSHSVEEVARLADHLLLMNNGRIQQAGPAMELMSRADFPVQLGDDLGVLLEAEVVERHEEWSLLRACVAGSVFWLRDSGESPGERIRIRILARDVSLTRSEDQQTSILNRIPMRVREITSDADPAMVLVRMVSQDASDNLESPQIIARVTRRSLHQLALEENSSVWAQIKSVAIVR